eukprot:GHVQ01017051.1.p1 GENE.GHVQ01017051.1~~GHVQ01017051.1.p1  ORF type:complete len:616 (+),score=96.34 GHVQ01017051.1:706-2553(+)
MEESVSGGKNKQTSSVKQDYSSTLDLFTGRVSSDAASFRSHDGPSSRNAVVDEVVASVKRTSKDESEGSLGELLLSNVSQNDQFGEKKERSAFPLECSGNDVSEFVMVGDGEETDQVLQIVSSGREERAGKGDVSRMHSPSSSVANSKRSFLKLTDRGEVDTGGGSGMKGLREGEKHWLNLRSMKVNLRRHVLIEICEGKHSIRDWQCAELLDRIHRHNINKVLCNDKTGILTYRDCRQLFSDVVHPIPSVEVRRHCVVVCLPPVSCFVLHNTVFLLVVEELRGDSLIRQLVELSKLSIDPAVAAAGCHTATEELGDRGSESMTAKPKGVVLQNQQQLQQQKNSCGSQTELTAAESSGDGYKAGSSKGSRRPCVFCMGEGFIKQEAVSTETDESGTHGDETICRESGYDQRQHELNNIPAGRGTGHLYPFEYQAIEYLISASLDHLNRDISFIESQFEAINSKVRKKLSPSSLLLEGLHNVKDPIAAYGDRVAAFDKVLNELLSNSLDMSRMALTKYFYNEDLYDASTTVPTPCLDSGVRQIETPDPDLEILLEYFDQEMDQFSERVRHMREMTNNTERLIGLRLALMRNKLIYWELAATVLATGIAIATCLSGD